MLRGGDIAFALSFQMHPGLSVRRGGTLGTAPRVDETVVAGSRKKLTACKIYLAPNKNWAESRLIYKLLI